MRALVFPSVVVSVVWGCDAEDVHQYPTQSPIGHYSLSRDAQLEQLKGQPGVEGLELSRCGNSITDAGLACLQDLPNLKELILHEGINLEIGMTDAMLVHLKGLNSLRKLDLIGFHITDAGLTHVKDLPNLEVLILAWWGSGRATGITDAGLEHLEKLINLRELSLYFAAITDVGLVRLKRLTRLQKLDISHTQVTDSGLLHLKSLAALKVLMLGGPRITNEGLGHLTGLTNLEKLDLRSTRVTDEAVDELKKALPQLQVQVNPGPPYEPFPR